MISEELFGRLVAAASRAPSADNMQAWAFARVLEDGGPAYPGGAGGAVHAEDGLGAVDAGGGAVDAYLEPSRVLPTDVDAMFAWVGLGAAVENLVLAAAHKGFRAAVDYRALGAGETGPSSEAASPLGTPVTVRLSPANPDEFDKSDNSGGVGGPLAGWIQRRETNRGPYDETPLDRATLDELTHAVAHLDAGIHWTGGRANLDLMASMDARSTYIRLEHRPLHDELFDILRFSRRELERARFGLDFESLGVPYALVWMARLLRYQSVMKVVSRLGIGRLIARQLAERLRTAGAVCLVTARRPGPEGYVEAGRAMERLWLAATARGLAVQPHGVLPQYLTKLDVEPDGFLPVYAEAMREHREPFDALFPGARGERPAIVLRVGRPREHPQRRTLRLPPARLIR